MKTKVILTITFNILVATSLFAQTKLNLFKGQIIHQHSVSNTTLIQEVNGNSMEIKNNGIVDAEIAITEINTNISTNNSVTHMQIHTEVMGNKQDFDSDKKEDMEGPIGQVLRNIIARHYTTVYTPEGKLIKSDAATIFPSNASDLLGASLDDLPKESFLAIPAKLKLGDNFTSSTETDKENVTTITYTVQSVSGDVVTLNFTGNMAVRKTKNIQNMEAVVTATTSLSGVVVVDVNSTIIREKKTVSETKGKTEVMGQTIPFTSKSDTVTKSN